MSRRRRVCTSLLAAICVASGVGLTACSAQTPPPAPVPSRTTTTSPTERPTVVVNAIEPRRAMLPADIGDAYGARIGALIYRGLYRYDAKGRLVNEVAENVAQESPLRYRIKVRKGWVFGNGEPVTAASFVDSWTYAAQPAHRQLRADAFAPIAGFRAMRGQPETLPVTPEQTGAAPTTPATPTTPTTPATATKPLPTTKSLPTTLSGLRIVGDLEFTVTLAVPDATFPDLLAQLPYAPLPAAALRDPVAYSAAPAGNGPYQLAGGWLPGKEIRLIPNASYSGSDAAQNGGVTFRFFPDPSSTYGALLGGKLDVLDTMPLTALDRYKADLGFRAANQSVGAAASLVFPMAQARWSGPEGLRVRTSISRSIDRRALTDGLFAGTRVPAGDLASPVVDGYAPDLCGDACTLDPQAARIAVTAIKPEPIAIAYGADAGGRPVVEALCSAISTAIGVGCVPHPVASQAALERIAAQQQLTIPMLSLRRMARPDLGGFLDPRFRAASSANPSGYAAQPAQTLLARAAQTADDGSRAAAYLDAEKAILADLPEIPLWYVNATVAGASYMQPVKIDVFGLPIYTELVRE